VINTKSTTVVTDIIEELCNVIGVNSVNEREEFSLYCIVEGETFTVPLAKDHYILDVTTGIVDVENWVRIVQSLYVDNMSRN
jgi:myosin-15